MFGYIDSESQQWKSVETLPRIEGFDVIAFDTETYDPNLKECGSGSATGDGYIVGVSIAVSATDAWYIPIQRQGYTGFKMDEVIAWLRDIFNSHVTMVGANLMYDIGWLSYYGLDVECKLFDVQFAEALLDEHRYGYSLDSLAKQYGLGGKVSDQLYKWCAAKFGGRVDGTQRKNIHQAPLYLVGPYAEADAYLPLQIKEYQDVRLAEDGLNEVMDLECRLAPLLVAMRRRGVRVDVEARNKLSDVIGDRLDIASKVVARIAGSTVNVNAANDLAKVFDHYGWEYPTLPPTAREVATAHRKGLQPKNKPSFRKDWLMNQHDNEFALAVSDLRRLGKLKGTFVDGYFNLAHKGRIHCNLHPLRTGENGTVSGRLSCIPDYMEIRTREGRIKLRDVQLGTRVMTHAMRYRKVANKWLSGEEMVWRLKLSNGATLDCTLSHVIHTNLGWIDLREIRTYKPFFVRIGKYTVHSIVALQVMPVYDIEVEDDHSYYAGNILVHNCSNPNLQNIPARDPEFGPLIRGLFIPEEYEDWVSHDYSQIELRFLAHYALGAGAKETRKSMNEDPTLDFHQMVMDKTGLGRKPAKTISFSLCVAEGQLVLTDTGLVPIQDVTQKHKLWDGIEWCPHEGVLYKGQQTVITHDGLTATCSHEVWVSDGSVMTLAEACKDERVLLKTGCGETCMEYSADQSGTACAGNISIRTGTAVYDILNAGKRRRFTVSNVLVSNCYGSGVKNTAELLDCSMDEAKNFREMHFSGMPFMKATFDECTHIAATRGYLFTIMGRRARFPVWEANYFQLPRDLQEEGKLLGTFDTKEKCMDAVSELLGMDIHTGNFVQRARTYKALNSLLQGSAADLMKKAMVDIWESGVCDVLGAPLLTVHDELNWSVPRTNEGRQAADEAHDLMQNALKLKVPVQVSRERGTNWGNLHEE